MSDLSFYNKISQVALNELVDFLDHNNTEIIIKILDQYVKTNINSRKNEKNFSLPKFDSYNFSNEAVTCVFQVKEDRYFFKSYLNNANADYSLEIPSEVYQLQRRNDYRISMPIGVVYECEITLINENKVKIKTEIRDLSMGGCQLSIAGSSDEIKTGDNIELNLTLDRFEFPNLLLTAKHVKPIETMNNTLIGASYQALESDMLSEMQSLLMYLDRIRRGKE